MRSSAPCDIAENESCLLVGFDNEAGKQYNHGLLDCSRQVRYNRSRLVVSSTLGSKIEKEKSQRKSRIFEVGSQGRSRGGLSLRRTKRETAKSFLPMTRGFLTTPAALIGASSCGRAPLSTAPTRKGHGE